MRCKSDLQSVEATRTERATKLTSFITPHLTGSAAAGTGICLIARSLESPVVKAVAAATAEAGVPVRLVLASVDRKAMDSLGRGWEVRVLRQPRTLDAHEQLTVGTATWHGDSLRRDPDKRDAFQQFHEDEGQTLAWSTTSFSRMWALAEPVAGNPQPLDPDADDASAVAMLAGDPAGNGDPNASDTAAR